MSGSNEQDVVPASSPSERLIPLIMAGPVIRGTYQVPTTPPGAVLSTPMVGRRRCSPGDPGTDGTPPRPFKRPGRCSPGMRSARCSPGDDITERYPRSPDEKVMGTIHPEGSYEDVMVDNVETLATWEVEEPPPERVPISATSSIVTEDPWPNGTGVLRGEYAYPVDVPAAHHQTSSPFQEAQCWLAPANHRAGRPERAASQDSTDSEAVSRFDCAFRFA
jgi:hypothetical protein